MANTLAAVMKLTDDYTATMRKIVSATDDYGKAQQSAQKLTSTAQISLKNFSGAAGNTSSNLGSLAVKIGGIVSAAYVGKKAVDTLFGAIKTGAKQQVQLNTFRSLTGSAQAGTALYNYVSAYAKRSALGREDLASSTTSFLAFTKELSSQVGLLAAKRIQITAFLRELDKLDGPMKEFDPLVFQATVNYIKVNSDCTVIFIFRDGTELSRTIQNGVRKYAKRKKGDCNTSSQTVNKEE